MEDTRITVCVCVTIVLLFAIAVGGPVGCWVNDSRQLAALVAQGADPIEARCALSGGGGSGTTGPAMCIVAATRPKH